GAILEMSPLYTQAWEKFWAQHEKEIQAQLGPPLCRMTGLYNSPFTFFRGVSPKFACSIQLPGLLVESNGAGEGPDKTRWHFSADQSFPDGYEMKARSVEIDSERQKRILGRVMILEADKVQDYLEIVRDDPDLMQTVHKVCETGDTAPLGKFQPKT